MLLCQIRMLLVPTKLEANLSFRCNWLRVMFFESLESSHSYGSLTQKYQSGPRCLQLGAAITACKGPKWERDVTPCRWKPWPGCKITVRKMVDQSGFPGFVDCDLFTGACSYVSLRQLDFPGPRHRAATGQGHGRFRTRSRCPHPRFDKRAERILFR